jgi:FixJ family two-component response regulator
MSPNIIEPTVFIVDDDPAVLKALSRLLEGDGWVVETFDSAEAFLAGRNPQAPGCLVLDVMLPGLDGLELQRRLAETGEVLQIVFLTGHGDIPMGVRAIKAGAADFLIKPVSAAALLPAVRAAMDRDASGRRGRADAAQLVQRLASLTAREREVLAAVAAGRLNKQIAADLGIVEQTVKFHRARIMGRMQARSTAELMLIAARLGVGRETPAHRETAPSDESPPTPRRS